MVNNPSDIDKLYRTIYYFMKLFSYYLAENQRTMSGFSWALARVLFSYKYFIDRHSTGTSATLKKFSTDEILHSVDNIASTLGDARMVMRFFGSLNTLPWVFSSYKDLKMISTSKTSPLSLKIRNWLLFLQASSCLFYYPFDNIYFLYSRGYRGMVTTDDQADLISRISCQAWLLYIILDFILLIHEKANSKDTLPITEQQAFKSSVLWKTVSSQRFVPLLCDAILAFKWSFVGTDYISHYTTAFAGSLSSLINLAIRWKSLDNNG